MNRYELLEEYQRNYSTLEKAKQLILSLPNYVHQHGIIDNINEQQYRVKEAINSMEELIELLGDREGEE